MIKALKAFVDKQVALIEARGEDEARREQGFQFAAAMLLLEMTRADFDVKPVELAAVAEAIERGLGLSGKQTEELLGLAESEINHATSLYEFTRTLNDHLDPPGRKHIVELLWRVAFADGEVDKYEEHLVRKIAELLHVRHADFIRAKHRVEAETRRASSSID